MFMKILKNNEVKARFTVTLLHGQIVPFYGQIDVTIKWNNLAWNHLTIKQSDQTLKARQTK